MSYWNTTQVSRRRLLRGATLGAVGLAGAALLGCGEDDDAGSAGTTSTPGTGGGGGSTSQDVPRGGTLRIGRGSEPQSFDPALGTSGAEREHLHLLYDRLINTDSKGLLDASRSLAESWEWTDSTTLAIKLRPGVNIAGSDEAVDADLVAWNLDRNRADGATPRSELVALESVEVVSPLEMVLTLNEPSAPLLTNLTDRSGCVVSRRQFEKLGADDFARQPLGSGPFQLREWVSDSRIVYDRNPDYWGVDERGNAKPYLDTVHIEIIPENTVLVAALEAGDIDATVTPADDYARLQANPDLRAAEFVGSGTTHYWINHGSAPMDDARFRLGFSHALDRQNWVNTFGRGDNPLGVDILTPASWGFDPSIQGIPFDLTEARRLLEASSYSEDEWVLDVLPTGQDSLVDEDIFWRDHMAQIGITYNFLNPERGGWGTRLFTGLGGDGTATTARIGWSMRLDPDGNVGQVYLEKAGYNSGQAPVPELEPLVIKARQALDVEERKELYSEITRLNLQHVYSIAAVAYGISTTHVRSNVGNLDRYYGGEGKERWSEIWLEA